MNFPYYCNTIHLIIIISNVDKSDQGEFVFN